MRLAAPVLAIALVSSCSYEETTREVGHRGKARINPYLAAERFLGEYGYEIEGRSGWPDLNGMSMAAIPASALSASVYTDDLGTWVSNGGHAVVFLNHGEAHLNDWGDSWERGGDTDFPAAFSEWADDLGFEFRIAEKKEGETTETASLFGSDFQVEVGSGLHPVDDEDRAVPLHTIEHGEGLLSVFSDARPFRNRWIGDYDHAALLLALEEASPYEGGTVFVRNVGLSFWRLLWGRAWPAMIGLILLVIFWLWRNLPRFGPFDSRTTDSGGRAYEHHLGALGEFHWRLDQAEGLLSPLRESITERAHRLQLAGGARESDLFLLLSERSGVPRDRTERAMTVKRTRDPAAFTRIVGDLQTIHLSLP